MYVHPIEPVTRIIEAPVALVARAFTERRQLEAWLFHEPSTRDVECIQLEPRVDGLFRIRYRRQTDLMPVEHQHISCGAFEEFGAKALSFAWSVLQLYPLEGSSVVGRHHVRIAFEAMGAKTRIHLLSQTAGVAREVPRWELWLDALERLIAVPMQHLPGAHLLDDRTVSGA